MSRAWTTQERNRAIQWRNHGRPPVYIARRLCRSVEDVEAVLEAARRGHERPGSSTIPCMMCHQDFVSAGKHNRMCDRCRRESQDIPPAMLDIGDGCSRAGRRFS